jgi:hypothetical protein
MTSSLSRHPNLFVTNAPPFPSLGMTAKCTFDATLGE